ncbi:mitochondrial matrix iron-sulfur protein [Venturia inaequalis]|uniref:Mitochondrial matrix iron-sulfur protein n=1 Tax=Venturia inaequalis TaxID=5025 RepID=A0A8H3UI82_VENIN|nr:mitochondrial matrix iron-sulfur protein [Venturia inaequalis]KAE9969693.1 hypothetical protein EG328_006708 [Venturia inaequalis]KAE9975660.1 hypothetical protein EG327_008399 [Venturia inaequalis]RDI85132.1 hypothetical protein Vi05172_g5164 [Venturia inaequalis]
MNPSNRVSRLLSSNSCRTAPTQSWTSSRRAQPLFACDRQVSTQSLSLFRKSKSESKSTQGQSLRLRRNFCATPVARHGHLDKPKVGEERRVTFVDKDGDKHTFEVADGDNLLDIAQANDLEMEGACGGSCACSTCHVIVTDDSFYDKMAEPDDEENDMLDLAFGLTETSRLGCQVKMSKELDGLVVQLPKMTRNLQASDFNEK